MARTVAEAKNAAAAASSPRTRYTSKASPKTASSPAVAMAGKRKEPATAAKSMAKHARKKPAASSTNVSDVVDDKDLFMDLSNCFVTETLSKQNQSTFLFSLVSVTQTGCKSATNSNNKY